MQPQARLFRFGPFELDVRAGELRKHGIRIKLREQPVQVLVMLLEHPGEVVLRDDIRLKLWPNNTVVEFDHGINTAIQRVRDALGESGDSPRYVETVARRGYRFLGEVERASEPDPLGAPDPMPVAAPGDSDDLTGRILSHYRILGKLGEGGMGVVYRAEDLKLGRQVALKFLPTDDGELPESILRRFEREARAASALNHPNICTIHGLEDLGGQPAIVMELVEGETLAARLTKGPLPLDQAQALAVQIAGALAEAHRRGVVHRDLKPANIMPTRSGVKVLDFGLAKMERAVATSTEAETLTQKGAIAGTLHYMSPEQVEGKEADARSDIFSFGLVLYEMLTGRRAFEGESAASVMAGILEREPPPVKPDILNRVVQACLAKDPGDRFQTARDLQRALQWSVSGAGETPLGEHSGARRLWLAWGVAAASVMALAAVSFLHFRETPPAPAGPVRFQIAGPENRVLWPLIPSPDGRALAFFEGGRLWVRFLESAEWPDITAAACEPFWSPDSRFIGFVSQGAIKKIEATGGSPQTVADFPGLLVWGGGAWSQDGVIVFADQRVGLFRVPATGGVPVPITTLDSARQEVDQFSPSFLPDGRHFVYTRYSTDQKNSGVYLGSVDAKPEQQSSRPLVAGNWQGVYAPSADPSTGYLLYMRNGALMAQTFDNRRMELKGPPVPVADRVVGDNGTFGMATFSASARLLAYRVQDLSRLRWFDRKGNPLGDVGPVGEYWDPALSPDGRAVAVSMRTANHSDIWVFDLVRGTSSRLTFGGGDHYNPTWSPDGRQIAFRFTDGPHWVVHRVVANGSGKEELAVQLDGNVNNPQWTADGQYLVVHTIGSGKPKEIWAAPVSGGGKPFPVVTGSFDNLAGRVSPDGKWIAYIGTETGRREIYVQDFPPKGGKWQISTAGSGVPFWRADGRELLYREGTKVMSVEVKTNAGKFEAGVPKPLFDAPRSRLPFPAFAFSADGQKFLLVVRNDEAGAPQPTTVVLNWQAALKK